MPPIDSSLTTFPFSIYIWGKGNTCIWDKASIGQNGRFTAETEGGTQKIRKAIGAQNVNKGTTVTVTIAREEKAAKSKISILLGSWIKNTR